MSESLSPDQVPEQQPSAPARAEGKRSPVRWRRWVLSTFGCLVATASMGAEPSLPLGILVAWLGCLLAVAGLVSLVVPSVEQSDGGAREVLARSLVSPVAQLAGATCLVYFLLRAAVAGLLPNPGGLTGVLVTAAFLWVLVASLQTARALGYGFDCDRQAWWEHRGLWLSGLTTVLYLPTLGAFGLIDPWESHYGEVAREMLSRRDWISLWWAEDGWFWSKPILDFWAQGLSFAVLGVPFGPDEMLATASEGRLPAPEWAARFPFFLATLVGQYLLFVGVRRHVGRRAAFLGGLVLATCPYWYFLARQSMVDMLYVAPLCGAMGLLLVGLSTAEDELVRDRTIRWTSTGRGIQVSGVHLLWGALLLLVVPQVLYLVSRNVSFNWQSWPIGYFAHPDHVELGSPGNCGLPGNRACAPHTAAARSLLQPAIAGLIWAICAAVLVWRERGQRSVARLCFLGAWLLTALSFMAKGAPGLVLVVFTFLGALIAAGRYGPLRRCAPFGFALILACGAAPWFVQQYSRLGMGFVERLFIHDMVKRAFSHVHDTNSGIDTSFRYYVWQLGYGLFPWSGFAAVGTLACLARAVAPQGGNGEEPQGAEEGSRRGLRPLVEFMVVWQLAAFGMFSITGTKFHHYIFPLVPPAAMLAGVHLSELWANEGQDNSWRPQRWAALGLLAVLATAAVVGGLDMFLPGSLSGVGQDSWDSPVFGGAVVGAGAAGLAVLAWRLRAGTIGPEKMLPLSLLALGAAVMVLLVGRDLASRPAGDVEGQSRLLSLFSYTYTRDWPKELDFSGGLAALTWVAVALSGLLVFRRIRRATLLSLCGLGLLTAGWGMNSYLVELSSHWGQRQTLLSYYQTRSGPKEPVVAYQLNWKGENFYTGNQIAVFKVSGKKFKDWVAAEKKKGVSVMFFATEHARVASLKRELGSFKKLEQLTTKAQSSKFLMVRVEL